MPEILQDHLLFLIIVVALFPVYVYAVSKAAALGKFSALFSIIRGFNRSNRRDRNGSKEEQG